MKHAEDLGLRAEDLNPCRGLRRHKTGFKAHYLTDVEFAALGWRTFSPLRSERTRRCEY